MPCPSSNMAPMKPKSATLLAWSADSPDNPPDSEQDRFTQNIEAYEQRYGKGTAYRKAGIWITGVRMRAIGRSRKPNLARRKLGARAPAQAARKPDRPAYWQESGRLPTPIYLGTALVPGNEVAGPAVVEFPSATVVVRPRQYAQVDEFGNIILNL